MIKQKGKKLKDAIIAQNKKCSAKIISAKVFDKDILVLQLLLTRENVPYISSIVIEHANDLQLYKYVKDNNIEVFINPYNKHEVFIEENNGYSRSLILSNSSENLLIIIILSLFLLPVIFDKSEENSESFEDFKIIKIDNQKYQAWQLKLKHPDKIILNIYDLSTGKLLVNIEDKKDTNFAVDFNLSIAQQNDKVFILDQINNPYLDVYDVRTFKKVMDIKQFEQSKPNLKKGIARIREFRYKAKFDDESYYELICNDGNSCFYNISSDRFFRSEKEVARFNYSADSLQMSQYMYTFALLDVSEGMEKYQLCLIEGVNKENLDKLLEYAGNPSIDIRLFIDYTNVYPKWEQGFYNFKKNPKKKNFEDTLYKAKFAYFDFDLALIEHQVVSDSTTNYQLTGYDKKGEILFNIKQNQFPNIKKMIEDGYLNRVRFNYDVIKDGNYIILTFNSYGAICMDIKTGKTVWKFEPKE